MSETQKTEAQEAESRFKVSDQQMDDIIFGFCNDLTYKVRLGKTDPVIGRDAEIDTIITVLLQRGRSNVVLLGRAGVGKTAVFLGFARALVYEPMPKLLRDARAVEIDFAAMAAGTHSRSEFEGRIIPLIKGTAERNAIKGRPKIILCMDELHTTSRASSASSASGIIDVMKPYLTEGSLRVIGATTELEYNQFLKIDQAVDRRFQKIFLREPDLLETVNILKGLRGGYERHFEIKISDEAVEKIVHLTDVYMRHRSNPDKSLMIMDAACALCIRFNEEATELDNLSIVKTIAVEVNMPPTAIE
ncbi:MAG: AAA family ATPase [Alphaproteobacteria bacterium]